MQYAVIIQMCKENQAVRMISSSLRTVQRVSHHLQKVIVFVTLHCPIWGFYLEVYLSLAFTAKDRTA